MKTLFTKGGYCRNQPDLNACTHARKQTILPIIFDPSHVSGDHRIVAENLMAACGHLVDGTITETCTPRSSARTSCATPRRRW
jgi:3-deoxy-7-phosphoheptulonate synthase